MTIKQFFKPTITKIIFFIGLANLTAYGHGAVEDSIFCFMAPCPQPYPFGNTFFTAVWNVLGFPFDIFVRSKFTFMSFLGIAVNTAYLYTIAALPPYIINRVRTSHKSQQQHNPARKQRNQ